MVGWWPGGPVRCGAARWVCVAGFSVCRSAWCVRRVSAGLPSLEACALVPCLLGVLAPRGVPDALESGVVVPSGVLGPIPSCPSASLSSPVLGVAAVSPSPYGAPAVAPVWWPLLWPGSSPGGQGVVLSCAVFSAAPCVRVAPSPSVGVPLFPCAGSCGRWARHGAVRAASGPGCGGAYWRVCASGNRAVSIGWEGGAVVVLLVPPAPPLCAYWSPLLCPLPQCHGPWPILSLVLPWFLAPVLRCPR